MMRSRIGTASASRPLADRRSTRGRSTSRSPGASAVARSRYPIARAGSASWSRDSVARPRSRGDLGGDVGGERELAARSPRRAARGRAATRRAPAGGAARRSRPGSSSSARRKALLGRRRVVEPLGLERREVQRHRRGLRARRRQRHRARSIEPAFSKSPEVSARRAPPPRGRRSARADGRARARRARSRGRRRSSAARAARRCAPGS